MDIERARFNMIEQQIRPWEVLDTDVLDLLAVVRREQFVPPMYRDLAFADVEIPLTPGGRGRGEAMLTPKVEARILQELAIRKHETVLEIGTGSGYMAALLGHRGRRVTSVEILPELATQARLNLQADAIDNVDVIVGNGADWWCVDSPDEPFDVICMSGAVPAMPAALLRQIKVGGRIAAFVGGELAMAAQIITRLNERDYRTTTLFETQVAPLRAITWPSQFRF